MPRPPFTQGLHELGDGLYAWLQPNGGWGWSNAGLVRGDGASLLVDTLFDLRLTQAMLDAMAGPTAGSPVTTLVNTHANGDHCYGNSLVAGAEIVASRATADEIGEVSPRMLHAMVTNDLGDDALNDYVRAAFGSFDFEGIDVAPPTRTFEARLDLDVAGTAVELLEVGPAHTKGDVIVHVPSARTVFTGDICFIGGTPIVWTGPVANWVAACDRIEALGVDTVVPGHGPVCGLDEVRDLRGYLVHVEAEAGACFEAGMDAEEAARAIDLGPYARWGEPERIAVNVEAVYRERDPARRSVDARTLFGRMARWALS
ncbi:MAG: MBL fold metallo-hydrolase [Actinobacteria bacterium]|nr:MBL fold metallo-hydrolase [Actinomycetota bacterium]